MTVPTLVIIGDIGGMAHYHVGDEAMFTANIDWLKDHFPEIKIVAISADPSFTSLVQGIDVIAKPHLNHHSLTDILRKTQLLFISGGGNLTSLYTKELEMRSSLAQIALEWGIPIVLTGQTLGPFISPMDEHLLAQWLPQVAYLGLRDAGQSLQIANKLGVAKTKLAMAVDDSFLLRARPPLPQTLNTILANVQSAPLIGLTLHDHLSDTIIPRESFVKKIATLLDKFIAQTNAIMLNIPHVISSTSKDIHTIKVLKQEMVFHNNIKTFDQFLFDREVMYITAYCDFIISTRYHGVVFAQAASIPSIGIAQDLYTYTKLMGAFTMSGLPPQVVDIDDPNLLDHIINYWYQHSTRSLLWQFQKQAIVDLLKQRQRLAILLKGILH